MTDKSLSISMLLSVILLTGCQSSPEKDASSFYSALGGESGIKLFVAAYVEEIGTDKLLMEHYRNTSLDRYENMLYEYFCVLTGGECTYSGESLKHIHKGMEIEDQDFDRAVKAMLFAMEKVGWSVGQRNQILVRLLETRSMIVHD